MAQKRMTLQVNYTKEDWLQRVYKKNNSSKSVKTANTALNSFESFIKYKLNQTMEQLISDFRQSFKEDGQQKGVYVYQILDKYVQFLDSDQDIFTKTRMGNNRKFKRKHPKTIKLYFGFVKSYLRIVHGIKLDHDEIKILIQFPNQIKESRRPLTKERVKALIDFVKPKRKALYLVLLSSGMRIGEALALRKRDFVLDSDPIRIKIRAQNTKTREEREAFISTEAAERVLQILEEKNDDDLVFTIHEDAEDALYVEEMAFSRARTSLGFTEKYENSNRYHTTIHAFRAYFHTKASQKHGEEYANALDGHSGYLKQYYRLTEEERAKKYKELEPELLVESFQSETTKNKDKIIESMQLEMKKMQDEIKRLQLINQ